MKRTLLVVVMLLMAVTTTFFQTGGTTAQDATPVAANAPVDCTTVLGIGSTGEACVTVVHALSGGAAVDVLVDGEVVVNVLNFGEVSGYLALPAGEHTITVNLTEAETPTTLLQAQVTLEPGVAVEVAVVGDTENIVPLVLPVDLSPLGPGTAGTPLRKTRVRIVHAVADAPAVDVTIIAGDIAERVVQGLEFPGVADYIEKNAGTYRVLVQPSGLPLGDLELGSLNFEGDVVYTFYAIGSLDKLSLRPLPVSINLITGEATGRAEPAATEGTPEAVEPLTGYQLAINQGLCTEATGTVAWELEGSNDAMVTPWGEDAIVTGAVTATPVWFGEGVAIDATFDQLLNRSVNSLAIVDLATGDVVACGDIGGFVAKGKNPWDHSVLRFGLSGVDDSGIAGTAVLVEDTGLLVNRVHVTVALVETETA